ncbi:MAG: DnaJ domain-containing protein [Pyrinomonadaceae bacterium]
MTANSELEVKGSFFAHPFAEVIAEIAHSRLHGSLRVSGKERKSIIYFKAGRIVFAVSNARSCRLFDMMVRQGKLTGSDLSKIPNYTNDLELVSYLQENKFFTKEESDALFEEQIEGIIVDILTWADGDWTFSALARIRDGLCFNVATTRLLVDYGRCMPIDAMLARFRSFDEVFSRSGVSEIPIGLKPEEAFVLSRAEDRPLCAADLVRVAAMSESTALHLIYTLWLGGLLVRHDWQPALPTEAVAAMRHAKLELKQEAKVAAVPATPTPEATRRRTLPTPAPVEVVQEEVISVDEYLDRVEKAETYYDILGVNAKAEIGELKKAYFNLAKNFHPDRYHADGGNTLKRLQHAFTELAQAHETLKNPESRELYDFRMRKEIADREMRLAGSGDGNAQTQLAADNFERGFKLLMDNDPEEAIPFIARAVHYAQKNARYHAYYGKTLSTNPDNRHKAESELQTAVKLAPDNANYRMMLAEFYVEFNLLKRAEGELKRLLAIFPGNKPAQDLLKSLKD